MNTKAISLIKLFCILTILIIVPIILFLTCRETLFNKEWLLNIPTILNNNKYKALFVLLGLQILQIIICILPGQPIQFVSSYLFGPFGGFLLSIIGAFLGAYLTYDFSKFLGKQSIEDIFGIEKVNYYRKKINSGKGLLLVFIIYLIPGIPKDSVAYIAGISDIGKKPFLLLSTIGRAPGMLGSILLGYYYGKENYTGIIVLSIIVSIILIICFIYRKDILNKLDMIEFNETNERD